MWAKNIIPNMVWTNSDIHSPAPSLLKLGYHRSVDAHYLLLTTRELPKCSALGYGLDQVRNLLILIKSQRPYTPISLFYYFIVLCHYVSYGLLIPLYYFPMPHFYSKLVIQLSHTLCHHLLSSRSFPFE